MTLFTKQIQAYSPTKLTVAPPVIRSVAQIGSSEQIEFLTDLSVSLRFKLLLEPLDYTWIAEIKKIDEVY